MSESERSEQPSLQAREADATALLNDALDLATREQDEEALAAFDLLAERFGGPDESAEVTAVVVQGLVKRAELLQRLGRQEELLEAWRAVSRYGDPGDPTTRERMARALSIQAAVLTKLKRPAEAVAVCDELDSRFGGAHQPVGVAVGAARGLLVRIVAVGQLDSNAERRRDEKVRMCDQLLERYGQSSEAKIRAVVAKTLEMKASTLEARGRSEEAIAVLEELDSRFSGDDGSAVIAKAVGEGLWKRASALRRLGRLGDAVNAYRLFAVRHRDSVDPKTRGRVADSLFSTGAVLMTLDRDEEAIASYEDLARRFGGVGEPIEIQRLVSRGLFGQGLALALLKRPEEAVATCDSLIAHYGASDDPSIRKDVTTAFHRKALMLRALNRDKEAIAAQDEFLSRSRNSPSPLSDAALTENLSRKGRSLIEIGRVAEGLDEMDNALSILVGVDADDRAAPLVETLLRKGEGLVMANRVDEAVVVLDRAVEAYAEGLRGREPEPRVTAKAVRALLLTSRVMADLGRADEIARIPERLRWMLGDVTEPHAATPLPPGDAGSEAELAALLAATHESDCWSLFKARETSEDSRSLMTMRALELYGLTAPWLAVDVAHWDEPQALAAFAIRGVADGYAIVSHPRLPRNSEGRAVLDRDTFEWGIRGSRLDEWAVEMGHPLALGNPATLSAATFDRRAGRLEQAVFKAGIVKRRLASLFVAVASRHEVFRMLADSRSGRLTLNDAANRIFPAWDVATARGMRLVVYRRIQEAVSVYSAIVLMAESTFMISQGVVESSAALVPSRDAIRSFLDQSGAMAWLNDQEAELPDWLSGDRSN